MTTQDAASGMDEDNVDAMIEQVRVNMEQDAVPVEGSIRRLPVTESGGDLVTCVWDDDYSTWLRVLDHNPRPGLIRDLFSLRKAIARRGGT